MGKDVVEDYISLDINWLNREGNLRPGCHSSISWTRGGEPCGSISLAAHESQITLSYTNTRDGKSEDVKQPISISRTPCNYGGTRPWFLCPHCCRRVSKLYAAGKYFLCRHCYSLAYHSQQITEPNRLLNKAQAIRKRLGASQSCWDPIDSKPKGMHWKTFERLKHQALVAGDRADWLMGVYLAMYNSRHKGHQ